MKRLLALLALTTAPYMIKYEGRVLGIRTTISMAQAVSDSTTVPCRVMLKGLAFSRYGDAVVDLSSGDIDLDDGLTDLVNHAGVKFNHLEMLDEAIRLSISLPILGKKTVFLKKL